MNTTKSGSVAVGAPMSLARLQQELEHYVGPMGGIESFGATDEGLALIWRFIEYKGGHGAASTMEVVYRMSFNERMELDGYLYGALEALRYSMAGRVTPARAKEGYSKDLQGHSRVTL